MVMDSKDGQIMGDCCSTKEEAVMLAGDYSGRCVHPRAYIVVQCIPAASVKVTVNVEEFA